MEFIGSEVCRVVLVVITDVVKENSREVEDVKCIHHALQIRKDVVADIVKTGAYLHVHGFGTTLPRW